MRKAVLVANQCDWLKREENVDYFGVDKGTQYCLKHGISMKCALGDFDSLQQQELEELAKQTELVTLPCRKNETDGEYAIRYVHELGYDEIDVYGVTGGRLDHYMVIYNLLMHDYIPFRIMDKQNCIYALEAGEHEIEKRSKYISFFACEDSIVTILGVEYPLKQQKICKKDLYLVSNEILNTATIITSGKLIVIESDDRKDTL